MGETPRSGSTFDAMHKPKNKDSAHDPFDPSSSYLGTIREVLFLENIPFS